MVPLIIYWWSKALEWKKQTSLVEKKEGARKWRLCRSMACRVGKVLISQQSSHQWLLLAGCMHVSLWSSWSSGRVSGLDVCPSFCLAHLSPPAAIIGPSHPLVSVSGGHSSKFMSGWWFMSQGTRATPLSSFCNSSWPPLLGLPTFLWPQTQTTAIFVGLSFASANVMAGLLSTF